MTSEKARRQRRMHRRDENGIETQVMFSVLYDGGRTARMKINGSALDKGDHAATANAKALQRVGELPKGKIKSVKRIPPD